MSGKKRQEHEAATSQHLRSVRSSEAPASVWRPLISGQPRSPSGHGSDIGTMYRYLELHGR